MVFCSPSISPHGEPISGKRGSFWHDAELTLGRMRVLPRFPFGPGARETRITPTMGHKERSHDMANSSPALSRSDFFIDEHTDSKLCVVVNMRLTTEEAEDLDILRSQTAPCDDSKSRSEYMRMAFKTHVNWVRATMLGYAILRQANPFFELKSCQRS